MSFHQAKVLPDEAPHKEKKATGMTQLPPKPDTHRDRVCWPDVPTLLHSPLLPPSAAAAVSTGSGQLWIPLLLPHSATVNVPMASCCNCSVAALVQHR